MEFFCHGLAYDWIGLGWVVVGTSNRVVMIL